jgi:phage gpG-like protein
LALRARRSRDRNATGKGAAAILRDSGIMAGSITHRVIGAAVDIGPGPAASNRAATHQFGRPDNRVFGKAPGPIPARAFLPIRNGSADLPEAWAEEVVDVVSSFIDEIIGGTP